MERKMLIEEIITIELKLIIIMIQPAIWLILWLIISWLAFLFD